MNNLWQIAYGRIVGSSETLFLVLEIPIEKDREIIPDPLLLFEITRVHKFRFHKFFYTLFAILTA